MNLLVSLVFACLVALAASSSSCPEVKEFYDYCSCKQDEFSFIDPELVVRCYGLHDEDIVDILSHLKGKDMQFLALIQTKVQSMKKAYLQNLHIHELLVDNSALRSVEDGTLGSIEGLESAYFIKTDIQQLPDQTNATSLKELTIELHSIKEIGPENFPENSNLETLEIVRGPLAIINDGTFLSLKNLEELNLEDNFIAFLPELLTAENSTITDINLRHNHLEEFPAGIFENEKKLDVLDLQENLIRNLTMEPFKELLERETILYVGGNLISCDKSLCWLTDLLEKSESIIYLHGACRMHGQIKLLRYLESEELGC